MAYEILANAITLLQSRSVTVNPVTQEEIHDHVSVLRVKGDVVADDDISPVVLKLYEDKDPHTLSIMKKTSAAPYNVPRGGEILADHVMGPETGSPGVIMVAEAAELAEKQAYAGESDQPLAAGLSDKGAKKLEEDEFVPESSLGRPTSEAAQVNRVQAGMSVAEAAEVTNAPSEPKGSGKKASDEGDSKEEPKGSGKSKG